MQQPATPRRWRGPLLLQNDAIFEGEATDVPDGLGVLLTPSFAYMGEWKDGVQHGHGVYVCLVSRCRYEGRFVNGAAGEYGRLLLLSEGPTYVYGRFNKGRFIPRPSSASQDRNEVCVVVGLFTQLHAARCAFNTASITINEWYNAGCEICVSGARDC